MKTVFSAFTRLINVSSTVTLDNTILVFATSSTGVTEATAAANTLKTNAKIIVIFVGSGNQGNISDIASDDMPVITILNPDDVGQVNAAAKTVMDLLLQKSGVCGSFF